MGTSQNSSLHNTFSAIRKDGNRVEIEYVSQIIANTNPPQTFSLIRDVTKQKREHEQLQESEVRLAEAQHIAHIGDWIMHLGDNINMDTNLVELSDENCRLLGLDPSAAPLHARISFASSTPTTDRRFRTRYSDTSKADRVIRWIFVFVSRETSNVSSTRKAILCGMHKQANRLHFAERCRTSPNART